MTVVNISRLLKMLILGLKIYKRMNHLFSLFLRKRQRCLHSTENFVKVEIIFSPICTKMALSDSRRQCARKTAVLMRYFCPWEKTAAIFTCSGFEAPMTPSTSTHVTKITINKWLPLYPCCLMYCITRVYLKVKI